MTKHFKIRALLAAVALIFLTPMTATAWTPSKSFSLGWQNSGDLHRLFHTKNITVAHLNGVRFGTVRWTGFSSVQWVPTSGASMSGSLSIDGDNACFQYPSGRFCYRYFNDGQSMTAHHQGSPSHRIVRRRNANKIGNQKCPSGQSIFCGSSNCSGSGPRAICTMDMRCRCEPGGKPVWER